MNKNVIIIALVAVGLLTSLGLFWPVDRQSTSGIGSKLSAGKVVLHKSPTCGCCGVYGSYLKKLGYNLEIHDTDELITVKSELGIPPAVESCHTLEVGGYVVEGHIPNVAIEKLLAEQPNIKGIGLAGMPSGSPGMPGPQTADFVIYEIIDDGRVGEVFVTL